MWYNFRVTLTKVIVFFTASITKSAKEFMELCKQFESDEGLAVSILSILHRGKSKLIYREEIK